MSKAILIFTDGYSISTEKFNSVNEAEIQMKKKYEELNENDPQDEFDKTSYLLERDAVLYNKGADVFVWKIMEV